MDTRNLSAFFISPRQFNARLGRSDALLVLDVRREARFAESPYLLAGALRCGPEAVAALAQTMPSREVLVSGFALHDPALDLLASVVRGADTDRLDLAPQSAGLLAFSLGLSRLYAHDDYAMLQAALPLYDALYVWCQERVRSVDETHNWNLGARP